MPVKNKIPWPSIYNLGILRGKKWKGVNSTEVRGPVCLQNLFFFFFFHNNCSSPGIHLPTYGTHRHINDPILISANAVAPTGDTLVRDEAPCLGVTAAGVMRPRTPCGAGVVPGRGAVHFVFVFLDVHPSAYPFTSSQVYMLEGLQGPLNGGIPPSYTYMAPYSQNLLPSQAQHRVS